MASGTTLEHHWFFSTYFLNYVSNLCGSMGLICNAPEVDFFGWFCNILPGTPLFWLNVTKNSLVCKIMLQNCIFFSSKASLWGRLCSFNTCNKNALTSISKFKKNRFYNIDAMKQLVARKMNHTPFYRATAIICSTLNLMLEVSKFCHNMKIYLLLHFYAS